MKVLPFENLSLVTSIFKSSIYNTNIDLTLADKSHHQRSHQESQAVTVYDILVQCQEITC